MKKDVKHVEKRMRTTVDLPEELWRQAKVRAAEQGVDLRSVVIEALRAYLGRKG